MQLDRSDVITFHDYGPPAELERQMRSLEHYGRPLLCTEWMARPRGSTFAACLPILAEAGVGAICWGLVAGRSQCQYAWTTWRDPAEREPDVWFHDIFRADHTPYDVARGTNDPRDDRQARWR